MISVNKPSAWAQRVSTALCIGLFALMSSALADDTEVYVNPSNNPIPPNIMFVLDLSGSMNLKPDGTNPSSGEQSRLDILKQAITDVLNSNLPDVNVGLSTFTKDRAAGIKFPVLPIDADANDYDANIPASTTVGETIEYMVEDTTATGSTPTVDQLYEAVRYFRGESPIAPDNHKFGTWNTSANAYRGGWSSPQGWRAANPITHTGSLYYVHPDDPDRRWNTRYCNDYSGRTPPGQDQCADERAEGLPQKCYTVAAVPPRVCTFSQCDAGCGTYDRCEDSSGNQLSLVYTEPSNCLTRADGSTWVTRTTSGQPSRCCRSADAGGTECVGHQNYPSTCPGTWVNRCRTWNGTSGVQAYDRCYTGEADDRVYVSPITQQCQKSAIVLLTDGDPTVNRFDWGRLNSNGTARSPYRIRDMIARDLGENRNDVACNDQSDEFGFNAWAQPYANCGIELAEHIYNNNQVSSVEGSTIETHTIGFGLQGSPRGWEWLQRVAAAGGGQAYQADDLQSLVESFENVIASLTSGNQSFRNFSATFDVATLATGNRAYLSLFSPTEDRAWTGNLKGYFLKNDGLYDVYDNVATELDTNGQVVFKPTAKSFWSNVVDGNSPASGGAASTMNPATRDIYVITDPTEIDNGVIDLDDGNHDFEAANSALTDTLMGMPVGSTAQARTDLIDYHRSARMGDPLHTRPHIVSYGDGTGGNPGDVLFIATNQGYLHAFDINRPNGVNDTGGGGELFAFMPYEVIDNLNDQTLSGVGDHIYGIDGPITIWRQDNNDNGTIDSGDKVYLYFGMRRGGGAYYAMDVTDPENPKVMWKIDSNTNGFSKLGQSWSKMTLAKIKQGNNTRTALIFGGGYDLDQDTLGVARPAAGDDTGLGVYIVNAETGAKIKSIGPDASFDINTGFGDMKYAIPADVKTVDSNNNGVIDRLYFGDLGGQLWRIDIKESGGYNSSGKWTGYKLADFGKDGAGSPSVATNRRFFYPPSVARHTRNGSFVYALSIGSGYRAHPLDDQIEDRLFVFFDENADVGTPSSTPSALTTSNLYDATSDDITNGTDAQQTAAAAALTNASTKGWYIKLGAKEKVLARTVLFRNRVLFTSFLPEGSGGVCDVTSTTNRLYVLDLNDATGEFPVDTNNDGTMDSYDRSSIVADQAMILDEPMIVTYHDPGNPNPSNGDPAVPPSTCAGVYGGAQRMLNICSSPVKVNWTTLQ